VKSAFALALLGLAIGAAAARGNPTATPTPAAPPRLSGGFGRPAATPAAPSARAGQSLEDVVRAASETRQGKESPHPGVAITNRTLVTDPNRGRLTTWQATPHPAGHPAPSPATAGKGTPAAPPTPTPTAAAPAAADSEAPQEAHWRETARRARERVTQDRDAVAALEAEAHKLENDFYAWDDGMYRDNVIKPAWDKKREELETARRDLAEAEKDLADLPDKARKAGALPGWIRE
jgi:hypothetical protein